ncbi:MAG: RDD family protein [Aeromicrobium sp.]
MNTHDPIDRASTIPTAARVHQGHQAGIVSRLIAAGLDLVVVILLLLAAYGAWSIAVFVLETRSFTFPRPSTLLMVVAYLIVAISYLATSWWVSGRSYGQHLLGLRVTTQGGDRLRFPRALLRSGVCVGFPIGLVWVVLSRRHAAAHDLLLHTSVSYDWNA